MCAVCAVYSCPSSFIVLALTSAVTNLPKVTLIFHDFLSACRVKIITLGSLSLDTTKFVLLSFFSPIKTIYPRVSTKPQPNAAKSPLPVDVRRSKSLLLKLPIIVQDQMLSTLKGCNTCNYKDSTCTFEGCRNSFLFSSSNRTNLRSTLHAFTIICKLAPPVKLTHVNSE